LIGSATVFVLGLSQLVCWGTTYYLIGVFSHAMADDLGWSTSVVYGGFSAALLTMGLISPLAGRAIDRRGGRIVMTAGSVLGAMGCAGLALASSLPAHFAAWICLGAAMRLMLYDAAFASLARIGGPGARRPIAQITLLGGLASTTFWPFGHALAGLFGWRGALFVYAAIVLSTGALHVMIPAARYGDHEVPGAPPAPHLAASPRDRAIAAWLYTIFVALLSLMASGIAAHMIPILSGLGLAASVAVWTATLTGVAQSAARLCDVLSGSRLHPLDLNLFAAALLPLAFLCGMLSGRFLFAAVLFVVAYGVANGLLTITRGALPLVLFDYRTYGAFLGKLLVPSFLLSAAAPVAYAMIIERFGNRAALAVSLVLGAGALAAAFLLRMIFGKTRQPA
jgi:MFS family permease